MKLIHPSCYVCCSRPCRRENPPPLSGKFPRRVQTRPHGLLERDLERRLLRLRRRARRPRSLPCTLEAAAFLGHSCVLMTVLNKPTLWPGFVTKTEEFAPKTLAGRILGLANAFAVFLYIALCARHRLSACPARLGCPVCGAGFSSLGLATRVPSPLAS